MFQFLWCNFPFLLAFQSGYGQVKQQSHTTVPSELSLSPIQTLSACGHKSEIFTVVWWKRPLSLHLGKDGVKVLWSSCLCHCCVCCSAMLVSCILNGHSWAHLCCHSLLLTTCTWHRRPLISIYSSYHVVFMTVNVTCLANKSWTIFFGSDQIIKPSSKIFVDVRSHGQSWKSLTHLTITTVAFSPSSCFCCCTSVAIAIVFALETMAAATCPYTESHSRQIHFYL